MKYLQCLIVSVILLVMGSGFVKINQARQNVIAKKNAPDVTAFTIRKFAPNWGIRWATYGTTFNPTFT